MKKARSISVKINNYAHLRIANPIAGSATIRSLRFHPPLPPNSLALDIQLGRYSVLASSGSFSANILPSLEHIGSLERDQALGLQVICSAPYEGKLGIVVDGDLPAPSPSRLFLPLNNHSQVAGRLAGIYVAEEKSLLSSQDLQVATVQRLADGQPDQRPATMHALDRQGSLLVPGREIGAFRGAGLRVLRRFPAVDLVAGDAVFLYRDGVKIDDGSPESPANFLCVLRAEVPAPGRRKR